MTEFQDVTEQMPHCGIIMPISDTSGYEPGHWQDVLEIIKDAAQRAGFTAELVSANGAEDTIHASIIENIYRSELIVCDISSRNPNVMLELGLRLASKLPLIVIFDGEGPCPFDIGSILQVRYRKDLRMAAMKLFESELTNRIRSLHTAYLAGKYHPFLSQFKHVDIDLAEVKTETQDLQTALGSIKLQLSSIEHWQQRTQQALRAYRRNPVPVVGTLTAISGEIRDYLISLIEMNKVEADAIDIYAMTFATFLKNEFKTLDGFTAQNVAQVIKNEIELYLTSNNLEINS
ncbi:hypothetical protein [Hymenobacter defluvii]|uniref:RNA helicase n=1 Tax=Hymenobacter defluvii TaxID=2054411 RepID=A0ABS3TIK1_9BACT|nr:hypothetical protein [Hymenobacter defluvii]MBO3273489.1 hypothetical protein [Hymenobacter defluvii]